MNTGDRLDCRSTEAGPGNRRHRGRDLAEFNGFNLIGAEPARCRQTTTPTSNVNPANIVPNPTPRMAPNISITLTMNATNNAKAANTIAGLRRWTAASTITAAAHSPPAARQPPGANANAQDTQNPTSQMSTPNVAPRNGRAAAA